MRHHLESRLGAQIDNSSALVAWLVHENGRTYCEMATQHVVKHKVIGIAEKVHFSLRFNVKSRTLAAMR